MNQLSFELKIFIFLKTVEEFLNALQINNELFLLFIYIQYIFLKLFLILQNFYLN